MKLKNNVRLLITCDSGAGAGKTTATKYISKKYGLSYLTSGLLYRYLAMKLLFSKKTTTDNFFQIYDGVETTFNIDAQYRYFLGKHRNGFYLSSGLRYTKLKGSNGSSFLGFVLSESDDISSTSKFGITSERRNRLNWRNINTVYIFIN